MKKICTTLLLAIACLHAEPYVGIKTGFSLIKTNPFLKGVVNSNLHNVRLQAMKLNTFDVGFLLGYKHDLSENLSLLAETDYELSLKTVRNEDMSEYSLIGDFNHENISIRKKHAFAVMSGLRYNVSRTFYALLGLRIGVTQYEAKASHNDQFDDVTTESVRTRKFVVSTEPTVGMGFNINDKLTARMTVGYVIGQKKKIINDYASQAQKDAGMVKSIYVKPRGWNLRLAVIRSF